MGRSSLMGHWRVQTPGARPPLRPMDDPGAFTRIPWAVASRFGPRQVEVGNEEENQYFRDQHQLHLVFHGNVTGVKCDFQGRLLYTCTFH